MSIEYSQYGNAAPDMNHQKATGSGAINSTFTPSQRSQLSKITVHMSAQTASPLTITLDAINGAAYDTILVKVSDAFTDIMFVPNDELILDLGDKILITCANSGSATYGIICSFEQV